MDAGTLNCPACGAAVPQDATECKFCHAKLATVGCPSCFGLVFAGAKFCDHCGAAIQTAAEQAGASRKCPRGCGDMKQVSLGNVLMYECPKCNGLWLDPQTFDKLLADKQQTSSGLFGEPGTTPAVVTQPVETVRYVPCPVCGKLMNRQNFAHSSGVIIDICKAHGVWFDADELRRVIEFVRGGGMDASRQHELDQLQQERKLREFGQRLEMPKEARSMFEQEQRELGSGASLFSVFINLKL